MASLFKETFCGKVKISRRVVMKALVRTCKRQAMHQTTSVCRVVFQIVSVGRSSIAPRSK